MDNSYVAGHFDPSEDLSESEKLSQLEIEEKGITDFVEDTRDTDFPDLDPTTGLHFRKCSQCFYGLCNCGL